MRIGSAKRLRRARGDAKGEPASGEVESDVVWQTPREVEVQDVTKSGVRADGWRLGRGLLVWAVAGVLAASLSGPPPPLPADASADVGSGGRAREVLERIAEDGEGRGPLPRPVGSPANARCRERIVAEWRRLGLMPEVVERTSVAPRYGLVGTTRNIVTRMRGDGRRRGPGTAILCMAHYDSVPAGPGIGDDLSAVAALLEIARTLRMAGGTSRDVIFLVDDAEEVGLLGAEAFARHHPWAEDVGAVINLEARGASGPSRLFETGPGNADLVAAFSRLSSAPSASSVSVEVYRRMPNDTDFTVWRKLGVPGLNFAFIGDVVRYHTPKDDLQHLDPGSLQHHVTNGLEAIRALDRAPFPSDRPQADGAAAPDTVFFDVAGRGLWTMGVLRIRALAAALLLLVLLGVSRALERGALRLRGILLALGGVPLVVATVLVAASVHRGLLVALGAPAAPFSAGSGVIALSVDAAALGALCLAVLPLGRVASGAEVGAATALTLSLVGMLLSWVAPGAAFLIVLPVIVVAVTWFIFPRHGDLGARVGNAAVVATGVAAVLWGPLHTALMDAFGAGAAPALVAPLVPCAVLLLPVLRRAASGATPWVGAALLGVALVAGAVASLVPPFSADHPGRLNLVHVQDPEGEAVWQVMDVGSRPGEDERAGLLAALGGEERSAAVRPIPWSGAPMLAASTRRIDASYPQLEVLDAWDGETERTFRLRMRSPRGADVLDLHGRGLAGVRALDTTLRGQGLTWVGPGQDWCTFEVDVPRDGEAEVLLHDSRFGLEGPLLGRAEVFLAERSPTRVPSHDGDGSLLRARYQLTPDQGRGPLLPVLSVEEAAPAADGEGG